MNKSELTRAIKADMGTDADGISAHTIGKVIASMTDVIAFSLRQGGKVQIRNLCTFIPVTRPAHKGFLGNTSGDVPERAGARAKFSRVFLNQLNEGG